MSPLAHPASGPWDMEGTRGLPALRVTVMPLYAETSSCLLGRGSRPGFPGQLEELSGQQRGLSDLLVEGHGCQGCVRGAHDGSGDGAGGGTNGRGKVTGFRETMVAVEMAAVGETQGTPCDAPPSSEIPDPRPRLPRCWISSF